MEKHCIRWGGAAVGNLKFLINMLISTTAIMIQTSSTDRVLSCNEVDRSSLLSFSHHLSSSVHHLDWSSADCCLWGGIFCGDGQVTHLWLPGLHLSGIVSPSLANLTFLSHLNLTHNHLSGPIPTLLNSLKHLQVVDLSSNQLIGSMDSPLFLHRASNFIIFNVSNNSLTGTLPSSICSSTPLLEILDFSRNRLTGPIYAGLGECSNLKVLRAGFNCLSASLPSDIYGLMTLKEISLPGNHLSGHINDSIVHLSNLTILDLQSNELTGGLPPEIGLLSNLVQLQLHTNSLNGILPPSLMDCSNLTTLLMRNNRFTGNISTLAFSQLQKLQAIDLRNNSFAGEIPNSLCLCRSLTAVRLAMNQLIGEVPPCFAMLKSLTHLSLSTNYLSNVLGALKILRHCDGLEILLMSRCFHDEMMPNDNQLYHPTGFQNLLVLSLGRGQLKGQIPSWIANLRKLKILDLSYNKITGPIPRWIGDMPSLSVLDLTQNYLSGNLPHELGRLPALIADNSSTDLSSLALPLSFNSQQYNHLLHFAPALRVRNNNLGGNIPGEIGRLKLLHILDLSNNNFNGMIPNPLGRLTNLERLDMSGNHLSGELPTSLKKLHFLSWFSVAGKDLQGQIPRGGQFDTFTAASFEGNDKLCGYLLNKSCQVTKQEEKMTPDEEEENESLWDNLIFPIGLGYSVGLLAVTICLLFKITSRRCCPDRTEGRVASRSLQ